MTSQWKKVLGGPELQLGSGSHLNVHSPAPYSTTPATKPDASCGSVAAPCRCLARQNGTALRQNQEQDGDLTKVGLQAEQLEPSPQSDSRSVKTSLERTLTAITNGNTHLHEAVSRLETGSEPPFTKGQRQCTDSLESLYSLKSGQSSSSGVTSGSYCYSNRGSLRLEDDLLYTRQFCGRARVHTDHVPSPYDTESLTLKVGDVIDIISKPTMGIWTGVLNGRTGNFKFIYVDVLTEESPEKCCQRVRHKSTVQEVLRRLSLEEYYPSLQLHGYQTVDDLMSLKEHHLMELNVTDAEHKRRLLAAVESLRQLRSDSQLENEVNQEAEVPSENMKADMNTYPRDSSCHMPSDSPDNHTDHRHQPFPSEHPLPAEMTAS
ncbi:SAM domain-containing protein SAMSN-1b [Channa argus]|uniref:SAM domain-containing protein SAMSN-1b n=1 Tax=Channa argus TaxID=215402 RepID=UPI003521F5EC